MNRLRRANVAQEGEVQPYAGLKSMGKRQLLWFAPAVLAGAFVVILAALLWYFHRPATKQRLHHLEADARSAQLVIQSNLDGNRHYFSSLAESIALGSVDEQIFQRRVSKFVQDHPGVINVTWADTDFVVRWTAPYEPNKQVIGLELNLPGPKRASRRARDTRRPVYTRPFDLVQGMLGFEVYLPVYHGDEFLGTIGGSYSCEKLLGHAAGPHITNDYRIRFVSESGAILAQSATTSPVDEELSRQIPLGPPELGMAVSLTGYKRNPFDWWVGLFVLLCVALALGIAMAMFALRRDAMVRRRARAALEDSRSFLQTVIDSIPDVTMVIDRNYRVILANRAAREATGKDPVYDCLACHQVFHGSDVPCKGQADPCPLEQIIKTKAPVTLTHTHQGADGNEMIVEISAAPIFDKDGEVVQIIESCRDITERKRADEEHVRLYTAIEQAEEAVIITDIDANIQYVNPAFERITGYSREEAIGQNPRILKSGKQDSRFYENLWETLTNGDVWTGHFVNKSKDGTIYEEDATISPVRDSSGKIVNYVGVKRDVTEQVALAEQLRQSQKMDAIGQLAGGIAHEFNNILTVIIGNAELLRRGLESGSDLAKTADQIAKVSRRAANLTGQLLAFARKGKFQAVAVDIHNSVAEVVNLLTRTIDRRIEIRQELKADPSVTTGDPSQLQNALLNLGLNARDAMPAGGRMVFATDVVTLDARFCREQVPPIEPGRYLRISVSDTGVGMDKETLSRLYEPFFTTKDVGKGTGLGLASVYGAMENHHGTIHIDSELEKGTTVTLYLPLAASPAEPFEESHPAPPAKGTGRILLVDDDPSVREVVAMALRHASYTVTSCSDGVEAIESYEDHHKEFDLVILDLIMPKMNGHDTFRRMKEINPDVRALIFSGYSVDEVAQQALGEGALDFLAKPFKINRLLSAVAKAISTPSARNAP